MDRREKNGNWIMGRKKKYNNNNGKMGEVRNRWRGVVVGYSFLFGDNIWIGVKKMVIGLWEERRNIIIIMGKWVR